MCWKSTVFFHRYINLFFHIRAQTLVNVVVFKMLIYLTFVQYTTDNHPGASEASSKWAGKTKKYSTGNQKWLGKRPFSIKIKQKSEWARAHPAHQAPTPLSSISMLLLMNMSYEKFIRIE